MLPTSKQTAANLQKKEYSDYFITDLFLKEEAEVYIVGKNKLSPIDSSHI